MNVALIVNKSLQGMICQSISYTPSIITTSFLKNSLRKQNLTLFQVNIIQPDVQTKIERKRKIVSKNIQ